MLMKAVVFLALWAVVVAESKGFTKMGVMNHRDDFVAQHEAHADTEHDVVFAVKQLNLQALEQEVTERATPGNAKYQQWMSFNEIGELTTNHAGAQATLDWLESHNIKVKDIVDCVLLQ
jgi:subtilase family serine protease